jgi:hypothetical protein
MTAVFLAACPLAQAQTQSTRPLERLSPADMNALADGRITIIKSTLQLTPEQEKYWPAIEEAIKQRSKDRQATITAAERTVGEARENVVEALRDRNPVDFMKRRADTLAQRATDLKKLADAWQPLYQTLNQDQKRRMGLLAVHVIREMRSNAEDRRLQADDDDTN